jgi:hypothetical protein
MISIKSDQMDEIIERFGTVIQCRLAYMFSQRSPFIPIILYSLIADLRNE